MPNVKADKFETITSAHWARFFATPKENKMKTLLGILLIGVARLKANDDLLFLRAIAQVESGNANHPDGDDDVVGPCGARGRYQISEIAWRQHTKWPHTDAHHPTKSQIVALKHLQWLRGVLKKDMGGEPMYHQLASAWLRGPGYRTTLATESTNRFIKRLDYSGRVTEIFKSLGGHEQ
jgi:hypothetical protein